MDADQFIQSAYESNGPRLRFLFLTSGREAGKTISQLTGTAATPKSNLARILTGLSGGEVSEQREVDLDEYVGKHFRVSWQLNPNSPSGNCYMALLWETREQCPGAFPVLFVHDESSSP